MKCWWFACACIATLGCSFDPTGSAGAAGDDDDSAGADAAAAPAPADAAEPPPPVDAAALAADATPAACPPGWSERAPSCYLLVSNLSGWDDARAQCTTLGGQLAIITDDGEDDFVAGMTGQQDAWIGGSDSGQEGQWKWVDGSAVAYTRWAFTQPDNFLFGENCLELWGGPDWNDGDCSDGQPFVCERARAE